MIPFYDTYEELKTAMSNCEQTKDLSVWEHCHMVEKFYRDIVCGKIQDDFLISMYEELKDDDLLDSDTIYCYQVMHDCGKPLVKTEDGKFPNHSEVSSQQYLHLYSKDKIVAELIKHDMDFHTLRGKDIEELWKLDIAPTLYLTAWAEIYANASMFGGTDSDSFKIKRKRLIQAGKKYK